MFSKRFLIAALACGACAVPAMADLTTYSSLAGLEAAVPADTFSSITFAQGSLGTSVTESGVVFSASGSALEGTTGAGLAGSPFYETWPAGTAVYVLTVGDSITITLPVAVNAVSLYFGSSDESVKLTVDDSGGGSPDSSTATPGTSPGMVNILTNSNFTTFTIQETSSGQVGIDDMEIGQAQTPEVATFLLVGTGLLGMGYLRRRERRRPADQQIQAAPSRYHSALSRPICAG